MATSPQTKEREAALNLIRSHRDLIDKKLKLRDRAIRSVHDDGLVSVGDIAEAAGVSDQTVANIIDLSPDIVI